MNFGQNSSRFGANSSTSTHSSQSSQSSGSGSMKSKSIWQRVLRRIKALYVQSLFLYRKGRTFLWFGTTGFIFIIAPFAFSHFLEISDELQNITKQGMEVGSSANRF